MDKTKIHKSNIFHNKVLSETKSDSKYIFRELRGPRKLEVPEDFNIIVIGSGVSGKEIL